MALDYQRVFWSDFRGHTRWRLMSPLQRLAFFGLIASQHELGGVLPNDPAAIRNLAEIPYEDWPAVWTAPLRDWFEPVDGGGIAEPKTRRLTFVDKESQAKHRRGADITNQKRRESQSAALSDTVSESQSVSPPSPSPSPSPSPTPSPTPSPKEKRAPRAAAVAADPWMGAVEEMVPLREQTAWAEACAEHAAARRAWKHKPLQPATWVLRLREWIPRGIAAFQAAVRENASAGHQGLFPAKGATGPNKNIPAGAVTMRDILAGRGQPPQPREVRAEVVS